LTVGGGVTLNEGRPFRSSSVFAFGLSIVIPDDRNGNRQIDDPWELILLEGEIGPTTNIEACHQPEEPPNCLDSALFGGVRYRFRRRMEQRPWPFLNAQAGAYWLGTGLPDPQYASAHFSLQGGGGLEFRWPDTIQALRVSADFRHVFGLGQNQVRVLALYMLTPKRSP
jgi:hypothetical protein